MGLVSHTGWHVQRADPTLWCTSAWCDNGFEPVTLTLALALALALALVLALTLNPNPNPNQARQWLQRHGGRSEAAAAHGILPRPRLAAHAQVVQRRALPHP